MNRVARIDVARHLHADNELLATSRIAADELHTPLSGRFMKTVGKTLEPVSLSVRQCESKRHPARCCTHRRNIRQIDGDNAITDVRGIHGFREMNTGDHGVDDTDKFLASWRPQHGAVVADTGGDYR